MKPKVHVLTDAEIEESRRRRRESGPKARSVRYIEKTDQLLLVLDAAVILLIPRALVEQFDNLSTKDLAQLVVLQGGSAIGHDDGDLQISVPQLVCEVTGAGAWMTSGDSAH